ncbi:MAG: hypothetical protein ABSG95_08780 [Solirubrobacteraceae bacterium]|jgi:hypothetical protein
MLTVAALAALGIFSSLSSARSSAGGNPQSKFVGLVHIEKTNVAYTAEYTDEDFGLVKCVGHHQTNSKLFPGNATEGGRDKWKCRALPAGRKFTNVTGGQVLNPWPYSGWNSDFDGQAASSVTGAVKASDTAYTGVAYYPFVGP